MSLLFDALKRAQQSVRGADAAPDNRPAPSATEFAATPHSQQADISAAQSILSASARPQRRISPILLGVLVALLLLGAGGWYYLQSLADIPAPVVTAAVPPPPQPAAPPPLVETPAPVAEAALQPPKTHPPSRKPKPAKRGEPQPAPAPPAQQAPAVQLKASSDPLKEGYAALTEGRLDEAKAHYLDALAQRPHEKDALLGLAVIAQRQRQTERALDYYQQVLSEDPGNVMAATALFVLSEQADPVAAEGRLKQLLEIKPTSPEPHYALGNVLARQNRWGEAQQAFFRAHSLKPENPLYAFNLAVALDHLRKPVAALAYYEKALQLARPGDGTVNRDAIRQRMQEIHDTAPAPQPAP